MTLNTYWMALRADMDVGICPNKFCRARSNELLSRGQSGRGTGGGGAWGMSGFKLNRFGASHQWWRLTSCWPAATLGAAGFVIIPNTSAHPMLPFAKQETPFHKHGSAVSQLELSTHELPPVDAYKLSRAALSAAGTNGEAPQREWPSRRRA